MIPKLLDVAPRQPVHSSHEPTYSMIGMNALNQHGCSFK
ncbi:hypothetical protein VCEM1676A_000530 [Vibrio cholerae O1 str. EM-1676A]|nr:hypothetical protein VCEM1676A_000530 [Vibrio cholerae O1 str. EM-1676A]